MKKSKLVLMEVAVGEEVVGERYLCMDWGGNFDVMILRKIRGKKRWVMEKLDDIDEKGIDHRFMMTVYKMPKNTRKKDVKRMVKS